MATIAFRKNTLNQKSLQRLEQINSIISEYDSQGYRLTLRQLYYQLVSRDIIPNVERSYKNLSRLLTEGRMCGVVDWDAIEDRLRQPANVYAVDDLRDALQDTHDQYRLHRQRGQSTYIEVWVEKDAISNVLSRVTGKYGINILVNRGYGSVSSIYDAYNRFADALKYHADNAVVIYLGDHDPSGLDMVRDINDRIKEMLEHSGRGFEDQFQIKQIALTKAQIKKYNPPPNPAKTTDSRFFKYNEKHGSKSWEVDALKPEVLHRLLEDAIVERMDMNKYEAILELEDEGKIKLKRMIGRHKKSR